MSSHKPNLILGFHGCDKSIAEGLINGTLQMKPSQNDYDWLGNGMYFWEYNETRAWDFAKQFAKFHSITEPAVVGAVLDLGNCLDLLDNEYLNLLIGAYDALKTMTDAEGLPLPQNTCGTDRVKRNLDCAVIQMLHSLVKESGEEPFDSVRGVFEEGKELYPGSCFHEKNHIQICICNPKCIKGFFLPRAK